MKLKDLEKHLKTHKCEMKREGGNHTIWENISNKKIASIPRHREIKNNLVRKICKELDIPPLI
ncbi:MAG: hypothetical protein ACD_46C00576G0006 [uncultured bacterium]|nr:MAG: hypothetical protein ACD_46C00576G0006 [uncultured bacterium]